MDDTSSQRKRYECIGRTVMQLSNEIEVLNDENAKLRQQLADVTESMGRVEKRCAKLRELVEILMPMVMMSQRYCSYICDVREQCVSLANPVYGCIKRKDIMKRADELGIEVP